MLEHFGPRRCLPRGEIADVGVQIRQFERGSVGLLLDERIQVADMWALCLGLRGNR
jgi:hypothetical protein